MNSTIQRDPRYTAIVAKLKTMIQEDVEAEFALGELVLEARGMGVSFEQLERDTKIKRAHLQRRARTAAYWGKTRIPRCAMFQHYAYLACHSDVELDGMSEIIAEARQRLIVEGDEAWSPVHSWLCSKAYYVRDKHQRKYWQTRLGKAETKARRLSDLQQWGDRIIVSAVRLPAVDMTDPAEAELFMRGFAVWLDAIADRGVTPTDVRKYRQRPVRRVA